MKKAAPVSSPPSKVPWAQIVSPASRGLTDFGPLSVNAEPIGVMLTNWALEEAIVNVAGTRRSVLGNK